MSEGRLTYARFNSPIGEIMTFFRDNTLCHLDFTDCHSRWGKLLNRRFPEVVQEEIAANHEMKERLAAYFSKDASAFKGISMDTGGTLFQQTVWKALCKVPFGSTETYSSIAEKIGKPKAVRAMAAANALNPISIIIPCHRVVGKDGSLTGYGGGLERKRALLDHEDVNQI